MRLFFAIPLPDALCNYLVRERDVIQQTNFTDAQRQRMRWIDERQYHVTQYFVGEVSEERLDDLIDASRGVIATTKPFMLSTERFEFKPRHNPRLLWLRFRTNETFATLMQQLHAALTQAQLVEAKPPEHPIPHVTLIRLKQIKPFGVDLPEAEPYDVDVNEVHLMQSFTKSTGAEYKIVERFVLQH